MTTERERRRNRVGCLPIARLRSSPLPRSLWRSGARQGQYEIIATDDHGDMLWTAKAMCFARPVASCIGGIYGWTGSVGKYNPSAGGGIAESDFASGSGAQDYLVDVHERVMDFCASGNCLGDATSNTPLAPAHLSFSAQNVRLVMSRFVVKVL